MKQLLKKIVVWVITSEARLVLKKYRPKIIAVTGSIGKTSTKDAIFSVLSRTVHARKSEKSYNGKLGIPLTILGCQNGWNDPFTWAGNMLKGFWLIIAPHHYPKVLVLEVGADRPGDIARVTRWLLPDIAVITAFPSVPVHIEFFPNREAVMAEKWHLAQALRPGGTLIVNGDDEDVMRMSLASQNKKIVYGMHPLADIRGSDMHIYYEQDALAGMTFKVNRGNDVIPVIIRGSIGRQNLYASLAALAVALSQEVNLVRAAEALGTHMPPNGRMKIIPGRAGSTIIDDTYNSSPAALAAALATLDEANVSGKKIAALGDMMELGTHSIDEHYAAGKQAADTADILVTVGIRARKIAEGALSNGMKEKNVFQYDSTHDAVPKLEELLGKGNLILVKGSQAMRMERIVEALMAEPEKAKDLLVRQDDEWKNK